MAQEKPGQTLQATALVHEAYIRLVDVDKAQHWNSRGHFFAAAAEAMRRILVENARRKQGVQTWRRPESCRIRRDLDLADPKPDDELLAIDEALAELGCRGLRQAATGEAAVLWRDCPDQEAADALGISRTTADRYWAYAKRGYYFSAPRRRYAG